MHEILLLYLAVGCLAGLLSGLFGVGGGIVIVPLLALALPSQGIAEHLVMRLAVATSLASIIATSISSVIAHQRRGAVQWRWVQRLAPGIVLGVAAGAVLAENLPGALLKQLFAVFLLYVAARLLLTRPAPAAAPGQAPATWRDRLAGIGIGGLSAIIGIGGGTLTVPYLVRRQLAMAQAVATSSACGLPIAIAGALAYLYLGWNRPDLPAYSSGYIYWPAFAGIALCSTACAPGGAWLAHRLPALQLKRLFALLLCLISARLLW
jgi:uncharacterized membrane protein YfcA